MSDHELLLEAPTMPTPEIDPVPDSDTLPLHLIEPGCSPAYPATWAHPVANTATQNNNATFIVFPLPVSSAPGVAAI